MKSNCKILVYGLLSCISLASCTKEDLKKEEQLSFILPFVDYTITAGDDPFTFKFKSLSTNYKELQWRFGDDSLSREEHPEHVYMRSGKYEVNLRAVSEDGNTARKVLLIDIDPKKVLQLNYDLNGNNVTWQAISEAQMKSLLWTFHDKSSSTDLNPVKTYKKDTIFDISVKMITNKGSEAELVKRFTTAGFVENVNSLISSYSLSRDNSAGKDYVQGSSKIFDNDITSKFYTEWVSPWWISAVFDDAIKIKYYGIGSANDLPNRDPKSWVIEGSNDGNTWEVLDTRSQTSTSYVRSGNKYRQMFYYEITNPKPFKYYRWRVTANFGDGGFQISEFQLFR